MTGPHSVIRRPPEALGPPVRLAPPGARPGPARYADTRTLPSPYYHPPRRRPVRSTRPAPTGALAVALLLVGLFAVGAGLGQATGFSVADLFRGADRPPPLAFPVLEPSHPVRVEIPAIKVKASLMDVGLAKDGSPDVPPLRRHREAGWFDRGPTPGQFGPAVIVGHADTRSGPSVFADLRRLKPGQRIEVLRRDHRVAVFEVNSVEHFDKRKLPVDRVYGDFTRPSLRLMTCGGKWVGGRTGYADNVVVFASLVSSRRA